MTTAANDLDYFRLLAESRRLDVSGISQRVRIAILSDASTQHLVPLVRVLAARAGLASDIYAAEFDTTETEILDAGSALYRFAPDFIVLLPSSQALATRFFEVPGDRASFADRTADAFATLWGAVAARSKAMVVQANVVVPCDGIFGSFGLRVPESLRRAVPELNARIVERVAARSHVLLCDLEAVASFVGKRTFFDDRMWTVAKLFCALDHLPRVAKAIVDVVAAGRGRVVKCVVVDLDDTLWGGVIGDDGLDGIRIGHFGEGEAFHRFQLVLRELVRRGIALAVCSKNDHDVAIRAFREHPEMVLRESDVAVFVANWETKVDNLQRIRATLDIGLDSMVFLDDNPFERNMVRSYLPDVVVPELPEDPSEWVAALTELNLFETTAFTDEDKSRARLYREEAGRKELATSFTDVDDYLESLSMEVSFERFDAFHLPRIAQLAQRSNQFNLTTRRESEAVCEAAMNGGPDVLPIRIKLKDRFGDHGLISIVIGRFTGDSLILETWIMSCRVLSRGVEGYTMNRLFAAARARGVGRVVGRFVPTAKNAMVRDFYAKFGFELVEEDAGGAVTWALDVARYEPRVHHLHETRQVAG